MMKLDDPKWRELKGGYGIPYDPRPALKRLEQGEDVWGELWENLHHQGDVGVASYAAVPHLVRFAKALPARDWNLYALTSAIEVERHRTSNPAMPEWLHEEYRQAWDELLHLGISDLRQTIDPLIIRSIVGVLALARGHIKLGAFIAHMDASELDEMLEDRLAWSELYDIGQTDLPVPRSSG